MSVVRLASLVRKSANIFADYKSEDDSESPDVYDSTDPSSDESDSVEMKNEKIERNKSTESQMSQMSQMDVSEANILNCVFDGIEMGNDIDDSNKKKQLKIVNVPKIGQTPNSILTHTGFRDVNIDEVRCIFKERPLGFQIEPGICHGFDARISEITKKELYSLGICEGMIITGLNNKDLLGCEFKQILNIIQQAILPITLRFTILPENSKVNWDNIRLGASVIKNGMGLDSDDSLLDFAYQMLTRQGLNIYEIRAVFRLIREQPDMIPPLEQYNQFTISNDQNKKRTSNNPIFVPHQWLKEDNLESESSSYDDDYDDEGKLDPNHVATPINIETPKHGNNALNELDEGKEQFVFKKPIGGYVDFFDDNDSSVSQTSTHSIPPQSMFDAIGLQTPPDMDLGNALYSSSESEDDIIDIALNDKNKVVILDGNGNIMHTPIFDELSDESDESENSNESNIENGAVTGVCSFIETSAIDIFDNDFVVPQLMLKSTFIANNDNAYDNNKPHSLNDLDFMYQEQEKETFNEKHEKEKKSNHKLLTNLKTHLINGNNKIIGSVLSSKFAIGKNISHIFKKSSSKEAK